MAGGVATDGGKLAWSSPWKASLVAEVGEGRGEGVRPFSV